MRRWWLALALLLSLGVNLGILGTLAVQRLRPEPPAAGDPAARPETVPPRPEGAPGKPPPEERPLPPPLLRLTDRLGLEGEERERFLAVQRQFFVATSNERWRLAALHRELRRELFAAAPDRGRIEALLGEIGDTYAALEEAMAQNVLASREILDPEQERQFLELVRRLRAGQLRPPGQRGRQRGPAGGGRWRGRPGELP